MRTTVPNGNLWLTEGTEIDVNDRDILNDGNLFFVWLIGYVVIPHEKKWRIESFVHRYASFGEKSLLHLSAE